MKLMEAQAKLSEAKAGHEQQSLQAQAKHLPVIAKAKVAVANASARRASKGTGAGARAEALPRRPRRPPRQPPIRCGRPTSMDPNSVQARTVTASSARSMKAWCRVGSD